MFNTKGKKALFLVEELLKKIGYTDIKYFPESGRGWIYPKDIYNGNLITRKELEDVLKMVSNYQKEIRSDLSLLLDYLKLEIAEEGKRIVKK